jgi:hypothetical protein
LQAEGLDNVVETQNAPQEDDGFVIPDFLEDIKEGIIKIQ